MFVCKRWGAPPSYAKKCEKVSRYHVPFTYLRLAVCFQNVYEGPNQTCHGSSSLLFFCMRSRFFWMMSIIGENPGYFYDQLEIPEGLKHYLRHSYWQRQHSSVTENKGDIVIDSKVSRSRSYTAVVAWQRILKNEDCAVVTDPVSCNCSRDSLSEDPGKRRPIPYGVVN